MENRHYAAANKALKVRKLEKALKLFNKALKEEPNNAEIYTDRGVCYFHMNDKIKALADMNKGVELQPDYSYRYSARAYIKGWLGDNEGAVADYQKAVDLDPEDSVAFNNLGLMQEKLGHQQKAQAAFERADKLAKAEKELMNKIDELEGKEPMPEIKVESKATEELVLPTKPEEGKGKIIKQVFTQKSTFKEFLHFIKNGFKIKDNADKS